MRYPKIIKRMADEGHELGNHTMTHAYLSGRRKPPQQTIEREIRMGHDTIVKLGGVVPTTIRPPGGLFSQEQSKWVYEAFGYVDVRWSVDPGDADPRRPRPDTPTFRRRVLSQVHDGAIILSHDLHQSTAAAIPSTLDALLERGYEFLTVSELLALDDPYENVRLNERDVEELERSAVLPETPNGP